MNIVPFFYCEEQSSKINLKLNCLFFYFLNMGKTVFDLYYEKKKIVLFVYLSTYKKSKNTLPPAAVFKNLLQIFCGFYGNSQNLLRPCEKNINIKM